MLKFSSYFRLRRPNGQLKKPQLYYGKYIICDDESLQPCGHLYEIVFGWLVIHVVQNNGPKVQGS